MAARHLLLFPLVLSLILTSSNGAGLAMQPKELSALLQVMDSLLNDPTWVQLHPHPCTDTPWPGVQCELIQSKTQLDPFLHVTKIHIGTDLTAPSSTSPCKPNAHLSPSLLNLPFLKSLSLFTCFLSPSNNVSLSLFTNSTSSLEQLVFKSNSGLVGEIPPSFSLLKSLRVLSLSQNSLSGQVPREIGGLSRLQQLDLSYNYLSGMIPEEIGGLTSLTILDLSWNKLQGGVPKSVGQLASLQKVDLSTNLLSDKIPEELGRLERLVLLDLSHNYITGPIPESLSGLKDLEYFLIENNPIGSRVPNFIGELKKLSVVGFSNCGFLGPIPDCFGSLYNLTALALDKNRLNGSVPTSLGSLPRLGQLNLSQNQLSGEIAFGEEFVNRLGNRLDVRENKGLCTNPHLYSNHNLYFRAPPCLDSDSGDGNDLSEDPAGKKEQSNAFGFERVVGSLCWSLGFEIFVILSFVVL